jgi:hypothetical protein
MPPKRAAEDPRILEARAREEEILAELEGYDRERALCHYERLCMEWSIENPPRTFRESIENSLEMFGHSHRGTISTSVEDQYGLKQLQIDVHLKEIEARNLFIVMKELNLFDEDPARGENMLKVFNCIFFSKRMAVSVLQKQIALNDECVLDKNMSKVLGAWNLRFRWCSDTNNEYQDLLLHLLDVCHEYKYRKVGSHIYEPILLNGRNTYSWRRVCTIMEFIHRETNKELNLDYFLMLTSARSNAKALEEHLTTCEDVQFPYLVKNRKFWSFQNGLYSGEDDVFYTFEEAPRHVPTSVVSSKFFEYDLPEGIAGMNWQDIRTPLVDGILTYQGYTQEEITWFYCFVGRCIYEVGERDGWQILPYLLGLAGTGKSTIIYGVVAKMYDAADVGIMSNNTEKQFGLSALYDKLLFVAGEVKNTMKLEQSEFQALVSGEGMSIAKKHVTAFPIRWNVPGWMAGNELPGFADAAGSIQRRIAIFRFERKVVSTDAQLEEKLEEELPNILVKANKVYRQLSEEHGSVNVWDVLPEKFLIQRDRSIQSISLIDAFMGQPNVCLGPDEVITKREFLQHVRIFQTESSFDGPRQSTEQMVNSLGKFGCVVRRCRHTYRGSEREDDYIFGLSISEFADDAGVSTAGPSAAPQGGDQPGGLF